MVFLLMLVSGLRRMISSFILRSTVFSQYLFENVNIAFPEGEGGGGGGRGSSEMHEDQFISG